MKSPELTEFFSLLGKAKKEKKEEFDNLLKDADINLDVLTSTVVTGIKEVKVNEKKQKKKEEKLIEQLDSIIDTLEKPKEVKDITEPAITVGVPEDFDVSKLEEDPITVQDWNNGEDIKFTEVDAVNIIEPEPIKTPEISDTVAQAIKFIEETNIKEEIENSDETSIDDLKGEIKQVRDILYKVLAHGPGSGEVNLLKLDDVDEDTAKVDGKFLKYDESSGKFIGADASASGDNIAYAGIVTAAQFSGYSHLIAPYASTKTITVKVATKIDGEHRYYGQGSSLGYNLDNVQSPFLTLTPGRTYRFDQSDSSNSSHPLRFYLDANKGTSYTTDITTNGTAGSSGAYVEIEVTDSTPTILHYQCSNHGLMGNSAQVNSNNAIKLNSQDASYYLNYNNFSNTPTIPSNNNQLTNGAGYITTSFTNTNQLTNGAGFITASDDITGNAATATILENARTIGGVSFNGSANIDLPGVNAAGNQNTTGTSAGLTGNPSVTVTNLTANGNVSIAGTLTYEDVTNVDSVGLITARSGIKVGSGITLSPDGDGFFTGVTTATTFVGGFTGNLTGTASAATLASNSTNLNSQAASFYLDYNNFSNTPTIPTNNNQLTNGAAFVTSSIINSLNASNLSSGTIPDARFPSALPAIDGSALTGIAATANVRTGILDVAGIATFRNDIIVGSGVTLSPDGDLFATGVTTSTSFVGDLTGDVTGDVTGTASNATLAVSAQGLTGSPSVTVTNVNAVDAIISGNLSVAGTITSLDQNDILATGIITASSGVDLGDPGIVTLSSDTLTTTSTSADTISSVSATVNRSATFQVQVTRGTEYHVTTINVVHDGTNAFLSEFGTIRTGSVLATFDADISGGNLRLRATPTTSASTVFKLSKTVIKV